MLINHFDINRDRRGNFVIKADLQLDPGEVASGYIYKIMVSYHDEDQNYKIIGDVDGNNVVGGRITFIDSYREYNMNRVRYYKIGAFERVTGLIYYQSPLAYLGIATDGIHETIQYYEGLLNNLYIGTPCLLLRRVLNERAHRCPKCWDNQTKQVRFHHCDTCYGTSFVGGYYSPIEIQIAINHVNQSNEPESSGENIYNKQFEGRTTHFPVIKPKDVIIDMDRGKRYIVSSPVSNTKLSQLSTYEDQKSGEMGIMSQIFRMTELISDDIIYDINPDTLSDVNPYVCRYIINNDKIQLPIPDIYKFVISFGDKYTISITGDGHAVIPNGVITIPSGYDRTVDFEADFGFKVSNVIIDGVDQGEISSYTFENITGNHVVYIETEVVDVFTINVTTDFGSLISPSGPVSVMSGGSLMFHIAAGVGYAISDVLVDGVSIGIVDTYEFLNVDANHAIEAVSRALYGYTITATAGVGGVISPDGDASVSEGSDATFTITPSLGYRVSDVLVNNVSIGSVQSFTFTDVSADGTIEVQFEVVPIYTIFVSTDIQSIVVPAGDIEVSEGGGTTLTFSSVYGYQISAIIVDGVDLGNLSQYHFTNVLENHTVSVVSIPQNDNGVYQYEPKTVISNGQTVFTLDFVPIYPQYTSMIIADGGVELVYGRDFSVSGNVVTYLMGVPELSSGEVVLFKYYY